MRSLHVSKREHQAFSTLKCNKNGTCLYSTLKILFIFSLHTKEHDCRIPLLLAVLPQPRPCAWHGLKQPAGKAAHVVALVFFKKILIFFVSFCMKTLCVKTWPPQPPCFSKAFADFTNIFWNSRGTSQKIWNVEKNSIISANSKIWERCCFAYPIKIFPAAALSRRYKKGYP